MVERRRTILWSHDTIRRGDQEDRKAFKEKPPCQGDRNHQRGAAEGSDRSGPSVVQMPCRPSGMFTSDHRGLRIVHLVKGRNALAGRSYESGGWGRARRGAQWPEGKITSVAATRRREGGPSFRDLEGYPRSGSREGIRHGEKEAEEGEEREEEGQRIAEGGFPPWPAKRP